MSRELQTLREKLSKRDCELEACKQENKKLRMKLRTNGTTMRNCNVCIVNNVFPYAKEPPILSPAVVKELLRHPSESIPKFVQMKHFTGPTCSRNIHLPNRRGNTVQVIEECNGTLRWVHKDRRTLVDNLVERHMEELREHYEADHVRAWRQWFIATGLNSSDARLSSEWKDQINKVDLILMNHQDSAKQLTDSESIVCSDSDETG